MIPSFGAKKVAPAFQVKQASTTANNSSNGSVKNLSNSSTPGNSTPATSIGAFVPLTTPTTPGANQPQQAPHLRQVEAGACSSDDDFEKENIVVGQKNKKQAAKVKKPKAKKDPDAPKRPLSAYMFFCAQERQKVSNELGNIGLPAISAEISRRWALVDATEKAKWIEEAAKDKERFNMENAAYLAKQNGPSGQAQAGHSNVKQAGLANVEGASKQADEAIDGDMFARSIDCGTSMELDEKKGKDEEDQGNGEFGKEAGNRNAVDATGETDVAQKAKGKDFGVRYKANPGSLVKQARGKGGNKQLKGEDMIQGGVIGGDVQSSSSSTSGPSGIVSPSIAKYFAFLFTQWSGVRQENPNASPREIQELLWKQWTATSEEAGNEGSQAGPAKKKAKKEKKTKDPLAPKKPVTPFMLFFHSMKAGVMESRPELSYREVMTELGRIWNELDQEQKSPYEAQYQELMVKWRAAMDEYNLANGKTVEPKKVGSVMEQQDVTVGEETMMEMAGFGGSKGHGGKIDEEKV